MSAGDPYAAIAALYDTEFDDATGDIVGYARRSVGGRLLVLGCGTGRVSHRLGLARPTVGLDRSEPMLARARARGGPTRYVQGDLRDFDLGRFDEILLPNGAFGFLPERRDQLACLLACARALPEGGALTIDLPMPDFGRLGEAHTPERRAWSGWHDGEAWTRTREVFRFPVAQRLSLVDRFYRGEELAVTSVIELRLVFPREIEWLCEAGGFWVDAMWGDHAGGPLTEGCDRLLVRAIRG